MTALATWDDFHLEMQGRLTHPMAYDPATDRYVPITWEAAFLFQVLGREFGTNNFPDCSNMCHEPTSVGLPEALGVGKGTVLLDDFDLADAVVIFGQNPGTNSPRMMTSLRAASRRDATIMSFNPFSERALERFPAPQNPIEMASMTTTPISSRIYQVRVGGDCAALKGLMKACLEADDTALAADQPRVLDIDFINGHTHGFTDFAADIRAADWGMIERLSGLSREDLREAACAYLEAKRAILVYGMGITQHTHGAKNVQLIAALAMLRGNVGRPGAGACPLHGHSNVQGNRTVGIAEKPTPAFLDAMRDTFGFEPPRAWPRRRACDRGDAARRCACVHWIGWKLCRGCPGHRGDRGCDASIGIERADRNEAQSWSSDHLTSLARERIWATPSGKAEFMVYPGLEEDPHAGDPDALWLTTMRSHDQYNTTVYSKSDRYRGVFGQRMVVFINECEMARRGLAAGDDVKMATIATDGVRRLLSRGQSAGAPLCP